MNNNQGNKGTIEDVQYAERIASYYTHEDINRPEYR